MSDDLPGQGSSGATRPAVDRATLGRWVQPQHLDDEELAGYREAFRSHPARLVVLRDFLVERAAERLSMFLAAEAVFRTEYGLYSVDGAVDEAQWSTAPPSDHFFRLAKIAGIPPELAMSPNALTYLQFRQLFQGEAMRCFFEALSGLPLGPSQDFGSHRMGSGDFLAPHSDDNRNRQLALVVYLSRDWGMSDGGELLVRDRSGQLTTVAPEFNSVVIFDVLAETLHEVPVIPEGVGQRTRLTIGGWYHRPS